MLKDRIVMGASAGGLPVLEEIVGGLPRDLQGSVFIVMHLQAATRSRLCEILQKRTPLAVRVGHDGEEIRPGHIYVARPDHHLLVNGETMRVTRGPRENRARPSVDTLFRSAAYAYGSRTVGVVLSGALDDGTAGLWAIKDRGGTTIVQDPARAEHSSMPESAVRHVRIDHVLAVPDIAPLLVRLSREKCDGIDDPPASKEMDIENKIAHEAKGLQLGVMDLGPKTAYTCPECHGVLVKLKEGGLPRFRCHTGHAYSISTLMAEVTESVEHRLWDGIRAIEEGMMLLQEAAAHARSDGRPDLADLLDLKANQAEQRAHTVRRAVLASETVSEDTELAPDTDL